MVSSITSLGIRNSAVRDVAVAAESHDALRLGRVIAVIKRWSWFVSIFGAAVMIAIAPLLSDFTFGSYSRTWDFILLSCVLMFYGLVNGEQTILQGVSSLRRLAHASVWGVAAGLLVSIPLFYFWGIDSIVTSIVLYQAMLLLFTWIFRHKDFIVIFQAYERICHNLVEAQSKHCCGNCLVELLTLCELALCAAGNCC